MAGSTTLRKQKAEKSHICEWCGEEIPIGTFYIKYLDSIRDYYLNDGPPIVKLHEECFGALTEIDFESDPAEWVPYENERPNKNDLGESL